MNILFIQNNGINESLIIPDIVAYLQKQKHKVDLFITKEEDGIFNKIKNFSPSLIVLPCSILDKNWYFDFAKEIKKNFSCNILMWGAVATFYPEVALSNKYFDFICRGEGEYAIAELAQALQENRSYKEIKNIGYKSNGRMFINPLRPLIKDLDELPLPNRSIYYKYPFLEKMNIKRFLSSRGCKNLCYGCWNNAIDNVYDSPTNFYRRKSPNRIIEEILIIKEKYPLTSVHFSDDLFIHPDYFTEILELLELYKKNINIKFTCNIRPDYLSDEIAEALSNAGCRAVAISVESGCCEIRNKILGKNISDEHIFKAANILHRYNIKVMTFNIMAIPQEGIDEIYKTIVLNQYIKADYTRLNMMFPIYNSDLYTHASKNNIFKKDVFTEFSSSTSELYNPIFYTGNKAHYKKLYLLFSFSIKFGIPIKFIKVLVKLPLFPIYKIIWLIMMQFNEKRFFRVKWTSGIKYFLHTRGVSKRSEGFTSIS